MAKKIAPYQQLKIDPQNIFRMGKEYGPPRIGGFQHPHLDLQIYKTMQESNGHEATSPHNEDPGKTTKNMQELLLKKQCRNQLEMMSFHYIMKIRGRLKKKAMQVLVLGPKGVVFPLGPRRRLARNRLVHFLVFPLSF